MHLTQCHDDDDDDIDVEVGGGYDVDDDYVDHDDHDCDHHHHHNHNDHDGDHNDWFNQCRQVMWRYSFEQCLSLYVPIVTVAHSEIWYKASVYYLITVIWNKFIQTM